MLHFPNTGHSILINNSEKQVTLGRDNVDPAYSQRRKISRSQCRIEVVSQGHLCVTSLSKKNPTKILFAQSGVTGALLLQSTQQHRLSPGDRVLLLATDPSTAVEIVSTTDMQSKQHHQPVALLLVGLQGSGKSTFAQSLVTQSTSPWVRINQDTIRNGSKGTREHCLKAATQALAQGKNIIVDRTNIDSDQRKYFIDLAHAAGASVHCCVLNLPVKVCMDRAGKRQNHEGGLSGSQVYPVIQMTNAQLTKAGMPDAATEGLESVIVCSNDADIAAALGIWSTYTSSSSISPAEEYNKLRPPSTKKPRIDSFFTKQQQSAKAPSTSAPPTTNAFQLMMNASKAQAASSNQPPHKQQQQQQSRHHHFRNIPVLNVFSSWIKDPIATKQHSEENAAMYISHDEHCVVLYDKYHKAKHHILVIARDPRLVGPLDLTDDDIPLVLHMKQVAIDSFQQLKYKADYILGFHSVPSMKQLHLHAVSTDFISDSLKNKKHWNSFTSEFFIPVDDVLKELEAKGKLEYDVKEREALLSLPLKCHRCGVELKNIPSLKQHIASECIAL